MLHKYYVYFRRLFARYLYYPAKIYVCLKLKFNNFDQNPPIIINTPGKVGSSSVYYTLKKRGFNVFHVHTLNKENLKIEKEIHLNSDRNSIPLHLIYSEYLIKKLEVYNGKKYFISLTRDPLSRQISAFFQNLDFYKNSLEGSFLSINKEMCYEMINKELSNDEFVRKLDNWYNREIENYLGIFLSKFKNPKNYKIFKNNNNKLLLIKMEDLSVVFPEAISKFLNLPNEINLLKENDSTNKYYRDDYNQIKKLVFENFDKLTFIKKSKYMSMFYHK